MNYNEKTIIIIGAGELQIPLIKAAKNLGLKVIATDKNPQAKGFQYSDDYIIADTMDSEESLEKIKEYVQSKGEIHGVVTSGTDASFTVATIASYFTLPGHDPQAAMNASDKSLMRKTLEQANVSIPKYKIISSKEEALSFFYELNQTCIIKPTKNMGARGVSLINHEDKLIHAIQLAQEHNRDHSEILIEEFIDAHELSIDALIHNGTVTITGIADRIIEYTPYFVETGHILPSGLNQDWITRAVYTFRDGIKALGLSHGAAKGDIKITKDKVWVIEIAARLSGGFMSSHTFPMATGIPLHEYMIKISLGEALPEIIPSKNYTSVERAIICPPGEIKSISIPEDLLEQQFITHLSVRTNVGDIIESPKNNLEKQGSVIATAPNRELALRAANKAIESIKFTVTELRNSSDLLKDSHHNARTLLHKVCNVCKYCDGIWCRGKFPGIGGVGTGDGFIQPYQRFREIKLIPHYIHNVADPDTSITMFNRTFSIPVFIAPISGAKVNLNNCTTELELQRALLKGANQAGSIAFTPDIASPQEFPYIAQAILENYGKSILICKPREIKQILNRYQLGVESGVIGLGIDIDGINFKTLTSEGQMTSPKNSQEIRDLVQEFNLPFIVKGILSPKDAFLALEAGATHLIISSHGGRVSESSPNPIDMLPLIREEVGEHIPIFIDGAIRSGADVIKSIIMGADAVLIGRPLAIHAIGGGYQAVTLYLKNIQEEIVNQMIYLGIQNINQLKGKTELILEK